MVVRFFKTLAVFFLAGPSQFLDCGVRVRVNVKARARARF